jgi:hypothetical protein
MTSEPVVWQQKPLSMSWCLDCHRQTAITPEANLVPRDKVTSLLEVEHHFDPSQKDPFAGFSAKQQFDHQHMTPPTNCGACHY